ncbi:hypothetical protein [Streptomyces sp. V1I1]|uniref:hypothetical protein n=1 Tax=Streptomyces sp. V1I1 TaxID=3042272 RepID=UPI002780F018|nr:hypothetical protein [Streptomyces sp. V1I1]MDQ0944961.1 hypothetical protein [Streptomyces sp. V1I1]
MGRHSLPDDEATDEGRSRPRGRRRTIAVAAMLVIAVVAGTGIAAQSGLLSFAESCEDSAIPLDIVASPDIAPAVREVADRARAEKITSDGQCMDIRVAARENYEVAQELADPERPVPLIAIAVGPDADLQEVDQIAKATGGAGYQVSDPAEIQAVILKAIMAVGQAGQTAAQ